MNNKTLHMTLCSTCANQYYGMADRYIKRADKNQKDKESCTLCRSRMGYDYIITEKEFTKGNRTWKKR